MESRNLEPDSLESDRAREKIRARRLEKLRFWRTACADEMPVATRHNEESEARPLFFFHGDWDNGGLYMARLAAELPCPVIALAPHLDPVPPTVRAMAQDRLPAILAEQPMAKMLLLAATLAVDLIYKSQSQGGIGDFADVGE